MAELPIDYTSYDVREVILRDGTSEKRLRPREYAERLAAACTLLLKTEEFIYDGDGNKTKDKDGNFFTERVNNFADAYETIIPIQGRLPPRYQPGYFALSDGMSDVIKACNKLNSTIWGEGWITGRNYRDPSLRRFSRR